MVQADLAELRNRLDSGEPITPGELAALLGRGYSRSTVHRMLLAGAIPYTETPGGHRLIAAADARRQLERARAIHGAPESISQTAAPE